MIRYLVTAMCLLALAGCVTDDSGYDDGGYRGGGGYSRGYDYGPPRQRG